MFDSLNTRRRGVTASVRSTGTAGMLASVEDDEEDMEEGGAGTPTLLLLSVSLRTVPLRVEGEQHV